MSEDRAMESIWTSDPNAEFAALRQLPQAQPTPERAQALDVEVREEVAGRAEAYRTPVTPETLRHCLR